MYAHQLVQKKLNLDKKRFDGSLARQALLEIYNLIWEIKFNAQSKSRRGDRKNKALLVAAERLGISETHKQVDDPNEKISNSPQLSQVPANELSPEQLQEFPIYTLDR